MVDTFKNDTADYLLFDSKTQFLNPSNSIAKTITADSQLNTDSGVRYVNGPIDVGDRNVTKDGDIETYGLTLSKNLMKDLKLKDGEVVYFKIE